MNAAQRLIIISGSQRSGTTLAQTLICNALPGAALLAEAGLLSDLFKAYLKATQKWNKTASFYPRLEELKAYFAAIVQRHINDISGYLGSPPYLVLKHPSFTRLLPEIAEVLPAATLIRCVRDPRDIVASYAKIGAREAEKGKSNDFAHRYIIGFCKRINGAYNAADGAHSAAHELRYEELVADTPDTLARLGAATGLPFHVPNLTEMTWLPAHNRHNESWITELEERAPSTESVGNFAKLLSTGEIALVESLCAGVMRKFGYAPVSRGASRWLGSVCWVHCLVRRGIAELKNM